MNRRWFLLAAPAAVVLAQVPPAMGDGVALNSIAHPVTGSPSFGDLNEAAIEEMFDEIVRMKCTVRLLPTQVWYWSRGT